MLFLFTMYLAILMLKARSLIVMYLTITIILIPSLLLYYRLGLICNYTLYTVKVLKGRNSVCLCSVVGHLPGPGALSEQSLVKNYNPLFQFFQPDHEEKEKVTNKV